MRNLKRLFFLLLILSAMPVVAQEAKVASPITIYGYLRTETYVDTHKGLDIGSDVFYVAPKWDGLDAAGNDKNQQLSSNISSMDARLGFKIAGPQILGAKTSAVLEGDYCGTLTDGFSGLIRLRQANCTLAWSHSSLTVGQAWHPFWGGKVFPTVSAMTAGAPFQPFNRSPQIRFDYKAGKFVLTGALVSEFQFRTVGPIGKSDSYARNSAMPELYLGAEFNNGGFTAGLGASVKTIKPYMTLTDSASLIYNASALLTSYTGMGYVQYAKDKFVIRAKSVLGQNNSYLTMVGGFGISEYNKLGVPSIKYTNYTSSASFINAMYGTKWQTGLFLGYQKNLGTTSSVIDAANTFGLLQNVQSMYRIAPSLSLNISKIRIMAEYENTMAEYGIGGFKTSNGLYDLKRKVTNNRVILSMNYSF